MFSGIIQDLGVVQAVKRSETGAVIGFRTALALVRIKIGDSIAVNGVCLTVISKARGALAMEVSGETLRRTTLGALKPGDRVNLERSLTLGSLLGGHLVAGHVDGVGSILSVTPEGESRLYRFEAPGTEARYLVEKGSIAVDGVSLTVFEVDGPCFTVALIPHTLKQTTLGAKAAGDRVNIESDLLGKYVEKFIAARLETGVAGTS